VVPLSDGAQQLSEILFQVIGAATRSGVLRVAPKLDLRLTLVAKAQGAKSGLLYDPDMGIEL
jgi:hypothetical protein